MKLRPPSLSLSLSHFQVLGNGQNPTYAVANSRWTGSFSKIHLPSQSVEWTVGGPRGDFELVDLDGTRHAASEGTSLWYGQHNLEYFGEDEYMMFDNNLNVTTTSGMKLRPPPALALSLRFDNNLNVTTSNTFVGDRASRLLIVQVDEPSKVATVTWELVLAEQVCGGGGGGGGAERASERCLSLSLRARGAFAP